MLPNFIIIGAAKAGTTALYWYLAEHPQVNMSSLKETNFFAYGVDDEGRLLYGDPKLHRFPVQTLPEYEELFVEAGETIAIGEASPLYIECPDSAGRIKNLIPEARIVCGLRHPVDRAYSDYQMYLRSRGRRFDLERDLARDAKWLRPDSHWMRIGRYHKMLRRYFDVFPRERIHIYLFDDLKRDPNRVVEDLYRFLDVDTTFVPDLDTHHNVGGIPTRMAVERILTNKRVRATVEPWIPGRVTNLIRRFRTFNLQPSPVMPAKLRLELTGHFRDDIGRTADLIERNLDHWL